MSTTNYEAIALQAIVNGCYDVDPETATADDYDSCYCATEVEDIAKACGITVNQAKGVLGSLIKKNLVYQHDEDHGFMINLKPAGYEAHKAAH